MGGRRKANKDRKKANTARGDKQSEPTNDPKRTLFGFFFDEILFFKGGALQGLSVEDDDVGVAAAGSSFPRPPATSPPPAFAIFCLSSR